jgi:sarcosine oxidase delta subunit
MFDKKLPLPDVCPTCGKRRDAKERILLWEGGSAYETGRWKRTWWRHITACAVFFKMYGVKLSKKAKCPYCGRRASSHMEYGGRTYRESFRRHVHNCWSLSLLYNHGRKLRALEKKGWPYRCCGIDFWCTEALKVHLAVDKAHFPTVEELGDWLSIQIIDQEPSLVEEEV